MIVLFSDFGYKDPYVGVMKGVIYSIAPQENIIDLCHEVKAQNLNHANTLLMDNYQYFPKNSIFCCVIDPGVGSLRKAILVKNKDYTFIGPDNGLFTNIIDKDSKVFELPNEEKLSATFHGRDLFAPYSAKFSINPKIINTMNELSYQKCVTNPSLIQDDLAKKTSGQIIYDDHFGNLLSNIKHSNLQKNSKIYIGDKEIPWVKTYAEIEDNQIACLISSSNRLEFAIKNGSAKKHFEKNELPLFFTISH